LTAVHLEEINMSLRARLHAAEIQLGRVSAPLDPIVIHGGIAGDGPDNFAMVGEELIERLPDETSETFRARVLARARAARQPAIFGGLRPVRMD
jgi:hypothetical protein